MTDAFFALTYLQRAFAMARRKPLLPWVLIPALFNLLLFGGLYYAAATITSIGYGDITPTHHNVGETLMAVLLMFSSCVAWAHLIGVFSGVVSTFNPERNAFREKMDSLNRFILRENFPKSLSLKMREYFHQSQHLNKAASYQRLTSRMSPKLQGEVAMMCNGSLLRRVGCFSLLPEEFVARVANTLRAYVFVPLEQVTPNFFYLVHSGIALYGGSDNDATYQDERGFIRVFFYINGFELDDGNLKVIP